MYPNPIPGYICPYLKAFSHSNPVTVSIAGRFIAAAHSNWYAVMVQASNQRPVLRANLTVADTAERGAA